MQSSFGTSFKGKNSDCNPLIVYMQDGSKPIHLASVKGHVQSVHALISFGCSPTTLTESDQVFYTL